VAATLFTLILDEDIQVDPRKFGRVYLFRSSEELHEFVSERLGPERAQDLPRTPGGGSHAPDRTGLRRTPSRAEW
jgi:hypothetical protein